jgi:hypothetical protein
MTNSEIISTIALCVSGVSLGVSTFTSFRDRGRLKATSKYYPANEDEDGKWWRGHILVEAVNTGRRPIILTVFGGNYENEGWCGTYLEDKKGVRLGENERFTEQVNCNHRMLKHNSRDAIDLWFEDTLGRRYRVKHAKKHLRSLLRNECGEGVSRPEHFFR